MRRFPPVVRLALVFTAMCGCLASGDQEPVEAAGAAIMGGKPATQYPEAVVVTASGLIPCWGVVLAPRVVLSAGHCRSLTKSYNVLAPNADNQMANGSSDWTSYNGDPATSSDTLLIFLDTPITLTSYPTISDSQVPTGTAVLDVGRTLNGAITMDDYYSPPVTIEGPGTPLGFPFNYEASPDISEDGDSGGPIEVPGSVPHLVVAIVDTDTIEQNITEASPIDLFARLDVVHDAIVAQIASHADAGAPAVDSGRAEKDAEPVQDSGGRERDASSEADEPNGQPQHGGGGGGCGVARTGANAWTYLDGLFLVACALGALKWRRAS